MSSPDLAFRFCEKLFIALRNDLEDPVVVLSKVESIWAHAPTFPETLFCKGCVLPVVDTVASQFLGEHLLLDPAQIKESLRCEGLSSLSEVYIPAAGQSGYGGVPWGTNYQ